MDAREVRELAAQGETFEVEFKSEEKKALNDESLAVAVACLANGRGGVLLLGVEDDGRISGTQRDADLVAALIANRTSPALSVQVEEVQVDGHTVLVVRVPRGSPLTATSSGIYRRRALDSHGRPTCLTVLPHELPSSRLPSGQNDFSTQPVPTASWTDLDPLEFHRFRSLINESGAGDPDLVSLSDEDIAAALGLVSSRDPADMTVFMGALLLFGTQEALQRHVPSHEAAFQVIEGSMVRMNEVVRWPLTRLAEEFLTRFRARNNEAELDFGLLRIALPDYSEIAFREALANALIHRDYTRLGAVHVQWLDDELAISSPGGFPEGVRLDNLLNIPPHPRNPVLAEAFKRVGLVERTGRGINRMFEQQLRVGRSAPSYDRSTETVVVAALPGGEANPAITRIVLEQDRTEQSLRLPELQVFNALAREREMTTIEAARLTQLSDEQVTTWCAIADTPA